MEADRGDELGCASLLILTLYRTLKGNTLPCYSRAANNLNIKIPNDINEGRLEEILMKSLQVPFKSHDRLRREIHRLYVKDPEKLKDLLIGAIALAGKKEKKTEFSSRASFQSGSVKHEKTLKK